MSRTVAAPDAAIERLAVSAYEIPTDEPESDGTLEWDSTTLVLVEASAGGETGLGFTYSDVSAAKLIEGKLADSVKGCDALSPQAAWATMQETVRNVGQQALSAMAISAVDIALWDLKARLLGVALADLLGRFHARVPVYGSGGFTSYSNERLAEQLGGWASQGIPRVKLKVGRDPNADPERVRAARSAVGPDVDLMVDANGAWQRKEALRWMQVFAEDFGVNYVEEPVTSDDLEGLRLLRDRGPAGMNVAAGEYGWDLPYFERMADCVDIQQADVTRCGGITNLLRVDTVCKARSIPFSAHCAPAISAHACCAVETLVHLEYFHDHVRIESMLFDGTLSPEKGYLEPDSSRPGLGLELRRDVAEEYAV
ncbi:MAG TPA: enolase C-terminal domain-like protein [Thermoleophilaceae bacterium]